MLFKQNVLQHIFIRPHNNRYFFIKDKRIKFSALSFTNVRSQNKIETTNSGVRSILPDKKDTPCITTDNAGYDEAIIINHKCIVKNSEVTLRLVKDQK